VSLAVGRVCDSDHFLFWGCFFKEATLRMDDFDLQSRIRDIIEATKFVWRIDQPLSSATLNGKKMTKKDWLNLNVVIDPGLTSVTLKVSLGYYDENPVIGTYQSVTPFTVLSLLQLIEKIIEPQRQLPEIQEWFQENLKLDYTIIFSGFSVRKGKLEVLFAQGRTWQ
jgi:hypothetical protein